MGIKFYENDLYADYSVIEQLETEFAKYTGFEYAVAVDSCTNAIKLCLQYERPSIVGVPDMTYVSVANEVLHFGAKLVLQDSCNAGYPYKLEGTSIWDSAHSVEKKTPHRKFDKYCYSFYPTKLVPSYQGGMICTDLKVFSDWARLARQMGRTGYGAYYDVRQLGWKHNMTPIQARQALESLHTLDKRKKALEKMCKRYERKLGDLVYRTTAHLFIIQVHNRDDFIEYMKTHGVQCSIHFLPIHEKYIYKRIDYTMQNSFEYVESIKDKIVSLPLHNKLTAKDQEYIISLVKQWEGEQ